MLINSNTFFRFKDEFIIINVTEYYRMNMLILIKYTEISCTIKSN